MIGNPKPHLSMTWFKVHVEYLTAHAFKSWQHWLYHPTGEVEKLLP